MSHKNIKRLNTDHEQELRFRCHYSIIIEKIFKRLWIILVLLCFQMLDEIESVVRYIDKNGFVINAETRNVLIIMGAFVGLLVVILVILIVQWAKTYISVTDSVIIMEKNTLFKKKRTIGISNVSNINTTQNLFEMLMGTCKIKIDTNSASTADETDIDILLKKEKAEHFQKYIMDILKQIEQTDVAKSEGGKEDVEVSEKNLDDGRLDEKLVPDVKTSGTDILIHGLCSMTISRILVGIAGVALTIWMFFNEFDGSKSQDWIAILPVIVFAVVLFVSVIGERVKAVLTYYDYRAKRHQGKIHLQYGLLKKVNYTIPVDKINVITIKQTFIARRMKKYMVQVVNIGMGDEEQEKSGFLLPYLSEEKIYDALQVLLPEFDMRDFKSYNKQPRFCIFYKISYIVLFMLGYLAGGFWSAFSATTDFFVIYMVGGAVILVWLVAVQILSLKCEGSVMSEDYMKLVTGVFTREYKYIQYDKIQYVTFKQNLLMKKLGITRGEVHVLAPLLSREHKIPYVKSERMKEMKGRVLGQRY